MQYRAFGRLDWKPSALGFGAMRLPVLNHNSKQIDEPLAQKMVRWAIDQGVNYVDTAYPYHGGNSERFLGKALGNGYRDRVRLATKMPSWLIKDRSDFDRYFNEQLERLQTDHIDFYLLHGLGADRWASLRDLHVLDWAERAMSDGRIGHLGFSFHDRYEAFQEIVDAYDNWTFCQIQYNYMDVDYQAGTRGLKYAADKGLAVVVMEPIRGGQLAKAPSPSVSALWDRAPHRRTPADWALQWVWDQPEVSLVLSGMSTMAQVRENVGSASISGAGSLTDTERGLFEAVRTAYHDLIPIPCTGCGYCQPCPSNVTIPRILALYNDAVMYDDAQGARNHYHFIDEAQRAASCVQCGECEPKCPQRLPIREWLEKANELLAPTA
jgi:uncharacterized protein